METEENPRQVPSIGEFFHGRSVLVTGATGFMGKVLIEKLLRSCPEVETIYLLMRPKKGHSVDERLEELRKNAVFTRLREERPGAVEGPQLVAVAGDVSLPGLGLSAEDRALLCEKISVFFHGAATVRFDDPLRKAVSMNTRGTYEAVKLSEDMRNLLVFLYVSTTYCNTTKYEVNEAVYPAKAPWRSVLRMLDQLDDDTLDIVTPKLLGGLPNTYAFSKSLAEEVVNDHRHSVPAIIFRPSIVCSSMSEPMPGWLDNLNGPAGLLIACGKGLVHSVFCNMNIVADFSPVDVAIKGMIVAAWKNGLDRRQQLLDIQEGREVVTKVEEVDATVVDDGRYPECVPVYNCATSTVRTTTIGTVVHMARELAPLVPLNDVMWYPGGRATTNRVAHLLVVFFMQILPAIVVDLVLWARGQKTRLLRMQRRIYFACFSLEFYLNNTWRFPNPKFVALQESTLPCDKEAYSSEIWTEDEREYFRRCMLGSRKYLLMESDESLPAARKHIWRMYWLDKAVRALLLLLAAYFLSSFFSLAGSTHLEPVDTQNT